MGETDDPIGERRWTTGTPPEIRSGDYSGDSDGYAEDNDDPRDSGDYSGDSDSYEFFEETQGSDEPKGGWLPADALGAVASGTEGLERRREWQVNIRMDHVRYAALRRAAELYGTRPTTMARILVNRGAEAVINAHRAEMGALDWSDEEG